MEKIIAYALITPLIILVYGHLAKGTTKKVLSTGDDYYKLRVHKLIGQLGWGFLLFGTAMVVLAAVAPGEDFRTALIVGGGLFVAFGLIGYYLIRVTKHHSLEFNSSEVEIMENSVKLHSFLIKEVDHVTLNSFSNTVIFHISDGRKVKASQFLVGLVLFIEILEKENDKDYSILKRRLMFK